MNPLVENAIADQANELRNAFNKAFEARLIKCLVELVPGFTPADLWCYNPRITIVTTEGERLKEVYLDAKDICRPCVFLFSYSDEFKVSFSGSCVTWSRL